MGLGIAAALVSAPRSARAQANYDGVVLGGRTAMMGGAAVARGSDGATAFVNPAGITRIPGESFSFSTFAVQMSSRTISNSLDPSGLLAIRDPDSLDLRVNILPNTFCLFLDGPPKDDYSGKSRHKYGVCAADAEKEEFFLSQNKTGSPISQLITTNSLTTQMKFTRSSVAFSWGFQVLDSTSIGVTARIDNSRFEDQTTVTAAFVADSLSAAEMATVTQSRSSSSWDSAITVGFTHNLSRIVTLGASLTTPSQHILGFLDGSEAHAPVDGDLKTLVQDKGDFRYNQPSTLRLGLAFSWPTLNFEVNGNFYGAQNVLAQAEFDRTTTAVRGGALVDQQERKGSITEQSKPVVNLAAGIEAFLDPDFSIVAGIQSDFSGLESRRDMRPADTLFRQRKDAVHAALGVAKYGSKGSILVGLRGYYSAGEVLIADATQELPTFRALPQIDWGLGFVVSGQISFEAVRDTAVRAASPFVKLRKSASEEEESAPTTSPSPAAPSTPTAPAPTTPKPTTPGPAPAEPTGGAR